MSTTTERSSGLGAILIVSALFLASLWFSDFDIFTQDDIDNSRIIRVSANVSDPPLTLTAKIVSTSRGEIVNVKNKRLDGDDRWSYNIVAGKNERIRVTVFAKVKSPRVGVSAVASCKILDGDRIAAQDDDTVKAPDSTAVAECNHVT